MSPLTFTLIRHSDHQQSARVAKRELEAVLRSEDPSDEAVEMASDKHKNAVRRVESTQQAMEEEDRRFEKVSQSVHG